MSLKVGITGGIGSGKSTVCRIFKILGIPVFEADPVAREASDKDLRIKEGLIKLFGNTIYTTDGVVNRKKLASIIFNDKVLLKKVNGIIHPVVREKFTEWCLQQNTPYIIHEAAILFESGFYKMMDFNILIIADKEVRINRITSRNNFSRKQVLTRMANQWDDKKKAELADFVIFNSNELLIPQVLEIDEKIKEHG